MRSTRNLPSLLLVLTLAAPACHKQPTLGGASLECTTDADCSAQGEGWRCYQKGCILNTPPTVAPLDTDYVALASPAATVSKTALATDPEGDPLTFTWTAAGGLAAGLPGLPASGDTLSVTPSAVGIYEFDVLANDGYADSVPVRYRIIVQPELDVVYVSTLGTSDDDCGTITAPCASINYGATLAETRPSRTVLVAASTVSAGYVECLSLDGAVKVHGCYDAETWEYLPADRKECHVDCNRNDGHRIGGTVELSDLLLSLTRDVEPPTDTGPDRILPLVTVWVRRLGASVTEPTPTLRNVDVLAAACGSTCTSIGVLTLASSPTLSGVNIATDLEEFDPVYDFAGILAIHGSPHIEGLDAAHTPDGVARGLVNINGPTDDVGSGVLAFGSALTFEKMEIRGGPAMKLYGAITFDSTPTFANNTIDLRGFATHDAFGLALVDCSTDPDYAPYCTCGFWLNNTDCPVFDEAPYGLAASRTVRDNDISLRGSNEGLGAAPCVAVGVIADVSSSTTNVTDNVVAVGHNITFGSGIWLNARPAAVEPSPEHEVARNEITLGDSFADWSCVIADLLAGKEPAQGAVGLYLNRVPKTRATGNVIHVGANAAGSTGVSIDRTTATTLEYNQIDVGRSEQSVWAPAGVGIGLSGNPSSTVWSYVTGNAATIADLQLDATTGRPLGGVVDGYGIVMYLGASDEESRAGVVLYPTWELSNNFLFGGRGVYGTGLFIATTYAKAIGPRLYANTIAGGGGEHSATSSGVKLLAWDSSSWPPPTSPAVVPVPTCGLLQDNLIDAGNARGARQLVDNQVLDHEVWLAWMPAYRFPSPLPFFDTAAAALPLTNVGQHVGASGALGASIVVRDDSVKGGRKFHVLLAGAGQVLTTVQTGIIAATTKLELARAAPTHGTPSLQLDGKTPTAWAGTANGVTTFVVPVERGIAVAAVTNSDVREFIVYNVGSAKDPATPVPCAVAMVNTDNSPPDDIVFIANPALCGGSSSGLWVMAGIPEQNGGGFKPAARIDTSAFGTLALPTTMTVGLLSGALYAASGDKIYVIGAGAQSTATFQLVGATPIRSIVSTLFTPPDTVPNPVVEDLVVTTENQVLVWRNINPAVSGQLLIAPATGTAADYTSLPYNGSEPCSIGSPRTLASQLVTVAVGDMVNGPLMANEELVVGCADGRVDVYTIVTIGTDQLARQLVTPVLVDEIASLTIPLAVDNSVNATNVYHDLLVVGSDVTGTVTRLVSGRINKPLSGPLDWSARGALALPAELAVYQQTTRAPLSRFVDGGLDMAVSQLTPTDTGKQCKLAFREAGAERYDLHLAAENSTDACIEKATPLANVTLDIEGPPPGGGPTRDAVHPDIGADEFGVP